MKNVENKMRRIRFILFGSALLLFTAVIAAAAAELHGVTGTFQKTCPLAPGGKVSLENINGNLKVITWNKDEVKIEAEKYADNKEALSDLNIEVDAARNIVAIHTRYPGDTAGNRGNGMRVDYILTVPRNSNLEKVKTVNGQIDITGVTGKVTVSTVNGSVDARDISGGCELETVNGKVDAEFTSLPGGSDVRLKSVNGALVLRLPDNPDASIEASTTVGNISNDFGLESTRESDEHSFVRIGDALSGKLGNGSTAIEMHTVNGSIDILKSKGNR